MTSRGCFDEECMDGCGCADDCCGPLTQHRNPISSVVAGLLFAGGWWFIIDAAVTDHVKGVDHLIGVFATIALIMVNAISTRDLDMYEGGCLGPAGARVWLIFGMMMSFGTIIAAAWIMAEKYLKIDSQSDYAGIAVFMQSMLIFASSLLFKFGRGEVSGGF